MPISTKLFYCHCHRSEKINQCTKKLNLMNELLSHFNIFQIQILCKRSTDKFVKDLIHLLFDIDVSGKKGKIIPILSVSFKILWNPNTKIIKIYKRPMKHASTWKRLKKDNYAKHVLLFKMNQIIFFFFLCYTCFYLGKFDCVRQSSLFDSITIGMKNDKGYLFIVLHPDWV